MFWWLAPPTIIRGMRLPKYVKRSVILSHYLPAKTTFHNVSLNDTEFATHYLEA